MEVALGIELTRTDYENRLAYALWVLQLVYSRRFLRESLAWKEPEPERPRTRLNLLVPGGIEVLPAGYVEQTPEEVIQVLVREIVSTRAYRPHREAHEFDPPVRLIDWQSQSEHIERMMQLRRLVELHTIFDAAVPWVAEEDHLNTDASLAATASGKAAAFPTTDPSGCSLCATETTSTSPCCNAHICNECTINWLSRSSTCPFCRSPIE